MAIINLLLEDTSVEEFEKIANIIVGMLSILKEFE
jgi:hypothetical protein